MNNPNSFEPRPLTSPEYVRALFEPSDNVAILTRERNTRQTLQRIARAEVIAGPTFQSWLTSRNLTGSDVFIGMNPIRDGAFSRTKESIREIRHIYLDVDREGEAVLKVIRASLEVPPPNFVLDTSPGKHQIVWRVEGFSLEQAESLLHNLASQLGGDLAATDATRVLRMPGFANQKMKEEFIVRAVHETDAVYSPRDFTIPDESPDAPRHINDGAGTGRFPPRGPKSQSEHDWAFAKRALARGDDPEDVIRRIADYRGDEKHSTYARRTVEKAQAHLQDKSFRHPSRPPTDAPQNDTHRADESSPTRP